MTPDAASWTPPMPLRWEHAWTRVYRRGAREVHIAELIYGVHPRAPASWDRTEGWYGTGSQDEYDRAARLPLCPACFIALDYYESAP